MANAPNRLAHLREKRGLSQTDLATVIGVKPERVDEWERGAKSIPARSKQLLANQLGVSIVYLMRWEDGDGHNGSAERVENAA